MSTATCFMASRRAASHTAPSAAFGYSISNEVRIASIVSLGGIGAGDRASRSHSPKRSRVG
jgi:hypothetical protein